METNHLTDEVIQAFVLKEIVDDNIAMHLTVCESCKAKHNAYQILVSNLNTIEVEAFSFDVSTLVMQKIEAVETGKAARQSTILFIGIAVCIICFVALAYPIIGPLLQYFSALSVMSNGLIAVSAMGIVFFLINDLFRQYKQRENLLFQ